jgi:hypothetical protein
MYLLCLLLVLPLALGGNQPPAPAQTGMDEEDVVAEPKVATPTSRPALDGPFAASHTYQFLQRRIVSRKANLDDLPGLWLIIRDEVEFARIRHALETAVQAPTPEAYRSLYAQFSRATPNPDVLFQYLDEALAKEVERGVAAPDDATQVYAWPVANGLSALVDAFEATRDVRFLELFIRTYDVILAHRDSEHRRRDEVRGRVMRTWGFRHRDRWTCVVTHAGRIGFPVTRFCQAVRDDRQLRRQLNEKAQEYLNSIKLAMREFDEDFRAIEGTGEGYYIRGSLGDVEPLNHMHVVGNTLVMLHVLTGREEYKSKAVQLANYFRGSVERQENGSYTWGLQPTPERRKGLDPEFVWKGEVTVSFPLTALGHGLCFEREELYPLVTTFTKNVWRGGEEAVINIRIGPELAGELKAFEYLGWEMRTASFLGWIKLDVLDPQVREIVEQAMATRTDMYADGWLQNLKTAEIYAYRMTPPGGAAAPAKSEHPATGG